MRRHEKILITYDRRHSVSELFFGAFHDKGLG
jgi:hypothetical protein